MLANLRGPRKRSEAAARIASSRPVSGNPYRAILRRDYPEPFIALLMFILGIWLWDHYFGKPAGYPPGTEEAALVRIDRDLRLADAMAGDPPWLRWLAAAGQPAETKRRAIATLKDLVSHHAATSPSLEALSALHADDSGRPVRDLMGELLPQASNPDFIELSHALAHHRGTWWQARLMEEWQQIARPAIPWQEAYHAANRRLRSHAIAARSAVLLIGLIGLAFIPATIRCLGRGATSRPTGYAAAWSLPLGAVIFMAATLAWIGFTMTLELGIMSLPSLHPAVGIFLDSSARLLPPLIALGLLFRRPSHAVRVLGLKEPPPIRLVLGLFTLLLMADPLLQWLFHSTEQPGNGLHSGEAGLWGLAFALVSACLVAPFAEEILYRGVLFRSFQNRLGALPGAILSSAVFATLHFYDGYGLVSVGLFGLASALLYNATRSLGACILLHMIYNSSIKIPEWIVYHASLS